MDVDFGFKGKPAVDTFNGAAGTQIAREDPLCHLPCGKLLEFRKAQTIYGAETAPEMLYLILEGKVKVLRLQYERNPVLVDIYQTDDFFGEAAFLRRAAHAEAAVAIENSRVMAWSILEIESILVRRPMLGIALMQLFVKRSMDFGGRIESLSVDSIPRRLARSLIHLSERLGHEAPDGSTEMIPITHELLSQYVGTSREIITQHMNRFRRMGYLRYSRRGILLDRSAWEAWLREAPRAS
jgi:CRP/FNR family cyclic AMP-dependent transcriptional regulator